MSDASAAFPVEKILQSYSWMLKTHDRIPWPLRARLEADHLALDALVTLARSHKRTELVDCRVKAQQLGRSIRYVQKHAVALGGRKLGGRWCFDLGDERGQHDGGTGR